MKISKTKTIALAFLTLLVLIPVDAKPANSANSLSCPEENQYIQNGECVDVEDVCGNYDNSGAELCTEFYNEDDASSFRLRGQCQNIPGGKHQCVCPEGMFKADLPRFEDMSYEVLPCMEPLKKMIAEADCDDKPNYKLTCDFSKPMKPCSCIFVDQCLSNSPCTDPNQICEHNEGEENATCRCKSSHPFFDKNGKCSDVNPDLCNNSNCASNESCQISGDKKSFECVSRCSEACDGVGQECRQDSVSNSIDESNFICTCKKGLTSLNGECVPIEENEIDQKENDVDVEPEIVKPEKNDKTQVENNSDDQNNDNDTQDANSEKSVQEAGAADGPQQTLFIVGVAVIIVVSIGILLWLKQRKEAGTEEENNRLNQ